MLVEYPLPGSLNKRVQSRARQTQDLWVTGKPLASEGMGACAFSGLRLSSSISAAMHRFGCAYQMLVRKSFLFRHQMAKVREHVPRLVGRHEIRSVQFATKRRYRNSGADIPTSDEIPGSPK